MALPANEHVMAVFDLAKSAVDTRQSMDEAVRTGVTSQYHRLTREHPEYRLIQPLIAVRKQLSTLAKERRDAETAQDPWKVQELTERMAVVAEGAMLWFDEQLGVVNNVALNEVAMDNQVGNVEVASDVG